MNEQKSKHEFLRWEGQDQKHTTHTKIVSIQLKNLTLNFSFVLFLFFSFFVPFCPFERIFFVLSTRSRRSRRFNSVYINLKASNLITLALYIVEQHQNKKERIYSLYILLSRPDSTFNSILFLYTFLCEAGDILFYWQN